MTLEQISKMTIDLDAAIDDIPVSSPRQGIATEKVSAMVADLSRAVTVLIAEEQKASEYQKALALSGECDCLDRIRKTLSEHHGCDIEFELVPTINMKTMDHGAALPPLYYHCDTGRRSKRQHVKFTYCPFCRRKLD